MNNYKHVYFRINTPSYYKAKYGVGFEDQNASEVFDKAATNIFLNTGWQIKKEKYNGGCTGVIKDKQELYLHPQSFSGVVKGENIPEIEALLSNSEMFKFERTDIYEDLFDMTDEEYINMLKEKTKEIRNDILKTFKTKKSNLYITDTWTPLQNVLKNYRVKRISKIYGMSSSDIDYLFMVELFENLINEGKIKTAQCQSGTGYRTVDYKDTKIIYKNCGEEQETICNYKSLKSILKRLQGCNWITDITVVDNLI
jgi:hypothetical protein